MSYRNINIPLPSRPFQVEVTDTYSKVVDKLDLFFDDVIRNYPAATQDLLRRMYYEDNGIVIQEDLLKEGTQAYWEGDREGEEITYRMVVDE